MNSKIRYLSRSQRLVNLALAQHATKGFGNYPSVLGNCDNTDTYNINNISVESKEQYFRRDEENENEDGVFSVLDNSSDNNTDIDAIIDNNDIISNQSNSEEEDGNGDERNENEDVITMQICDEDLGDTEKYEYFCNGIAVGIVEMCKDSKPGLVIHGKLLSDVEVKVKVLVRYDGINYIDVEEFSKGAFLALSKVKLRRFSNVNVTTKRKGRGSKVGASPSKWNRKRRKLCRDSGETYENQKGKMVPRRILKEKPCTACKFTQCANVSELEREELFHNFYRSGMTFDDQNMVIIQNLKLLEKK